MADQTKIKVLFVDDEPNVLGGLRRMLRGMRGEWEMFFAQSGVEALEVLEREACDVIVCDIRMPGMDGEQVLERVREVQPATTRIVLSGHADRITVLRTTRLAHLYLAKPCDGEAIKAAVNRTSNLRRLLDAESLRVIVSQMEFLPSAPSLHQDLLNEIDSPAADIKKMGRIISQDPGMTAKILQLANSAFFGIYRRISDAAEACVILGLDLVKAVALSYLVFAQLEGASISPSFINHAWQHSLLTGSTAWSIVRKESQDKPSASEAFTAGLLHDIGKLVLMANYPERYAHALERSRQEGTFLWQVEEEVFHGTHAAIGAYLMGLWGLPTELVEVVAFHHNPQASGLKGFSPLAAVHVADFLAYGASESKPAEEVCELDTHYLSQNGLAGRLPAWQALAGIVPEEAETSGS